MLKTMLTKVRLTWYFGIFFAIFGVLATFLPRQTFTSPALTLFSVNSFLYGFYISPILAAQKSRIEDLHRIVRAEANAIFDMVLFTKSFEAKTRNSLQEMFSKYIEKSTHAHRAVSESIYESIITYCLDYKGKDKDKVNKLLDKLVANQQNRTMLNMQLSNRVYSNEWMIIFMLFSITLGFVLLLDTGNSLILRFITALLCTGLTMLLVILTKLSTLTHKKAKQIWAPLKKLNSSKFYRID